MYWDKFIAAIINCHKLKNKQWIWWESSLSTANQRLLVANCCYLGIWIVSVLLLYSKIEKYNWSLTTGLTFVCPLFNKSQNLIIFVYLFAPLPWIVMAPLVLKTTLITPLVSHILCTTLLVSVSINYHLSSNFTIVFALLDLL